jgi:hypothetical protein
MACATPVISVAEGGPCESVIDGLTGLLVPRDEEGFAEALMRILEDAEFARALGRSARLHVESEWTWRAAGERLESALASLAGKRAAHAT